MKAKEVARLRSKLAAFTPHDWEDDIESCLNAIDEYAVNLARTQAQLIAARKQIEQLYRWAARWKSIAKRWRFYYKTHRKMSQDQLRLIKRNTALYCVSAQFRHLAIADDALSRILMRANDLPDQTIAQLARRAIVTIRGEQ